MVERSLSCINATLTIQRSHEVFMNHAGVARRADDGSRGVAASRHFVLPEPARNTSSSCVLHQVTVLFPSSPPPPLVTSLFNIQQQQQQVLISMSSLSSGVITNAAGKDLQRRTPRFSRGRAEGSNGAAAGGNGGGGGSSSVSRARSRSRLR